MNLIGDLNPAMTELYRDTFQTGPSVPPAV